MALSFLKLAILVALAAFGLLAPSLLPADHMGKWLGGAVLLCASGLVFWWTFRPGNQPARPAVRPARPDLPIRELFLALAPQVGHGAAAERATGEMLLKGLRTGELRAWGREIGGPAGLRLIEQGFWREAEWTYWFLPDTPGARGRAHATLADGMQQFRDVYFSSSETERLLPPRQAQIGE